MDLKGLGTILDDDDNKNSLRSVEHHVVLRSKAISPELLESIKDFSSSSSSSSFQVLGFVKAFLYHALLSIDEAISIEETLKLIEDFCSSSSSSSSSLSSSSSSSSSGKEEALEFLKELMLFVLSSRSTMEVEPINNAISVIIALVHLFLEIAEFVNDYFLFVPGSQTEKSTITISAEIFTSIFSDSLRLKRMLYIFSNTLRTGNELNKAIILELSNYLSSPSIELLCSIFSSSSSSSSSYSSSSLSSAASTTSSSHDDDIPKTATFDVFLSFRGEDTRNKFTGHLYNALCQKGIYTFLDDDKIERGEFISDALLKAIEDSKCSIIVVSENHATSKWCLEELVKIMECMESKNQIVIPIFYHVDPSDVRKQTGPFKEAFVKHEDNFRHNKERVQKWRAALSKVANLAGRHLQDGDHEAKFIEEFVSHVSSKVIRAQLHQIPENLFGIHSRIEKLHSHVHTELKEARIIGICGMGGIGKTTLAKAYYNWMSSQFEGCSFVANVREVSEKKGLVYLQRQLLSDILREKSLKVWNVHEGTDIIKSRLCRKKVLVIIDDVNELEQLKKLAGNLDWFGKGSRIIVTTRDESLLKGYSGVHSEVYKAEILDHNDALRLFCQNAFQNIEPLEDYKMLSREAVTYAGGLPLALEILGSFLCDKSVNEWRSALDRLKVYPDTNIVKALRISFDSLQPTEKNIFIDIACYFKGENDNFVTSVMNSCGFFPEIGIKTLVDKSLLKIIRGRIWMHDLIQEMGWEIVREKSPEELGKRSRLWCTEDLIDVFENSLGSLELEGIHISGTMHLTSTKELSSEVLSRTKKLRFLIVRSAKFFSSNGLEHLPNELRYLTWYEYPLKCFPSSFQPTGLVELDLSNSIRFKRLWDNPVKPLKHLKVLNLSGCWSIIEIKDFWVVPNLEKLILKYCVSLTKIDQFIGNLEKLTLLDLKGCRDLENIPGSAMRLKYLEVLDLRGCSKLTKIPKGLGDLKNLKEIRVSESHREDLPPSILNSDTVKVIQESRVADFCQPNFISKGCSFIKETLNSSYSQGEFAQLADNVQTLVELMEERSIFDNLNVLWNLFNSRSENAVSEESHLK